MRQRRHLFLSLSLPVPTVHIFHSTRSISPSRKRFVRTEASDMRPLPPLPLLENLERKIRHAASRLRRSSFADANQFNNLQQDRDDNEWWDCVTYKSCDQLFNGSAEYISARDHSLSVASAYNATEVPRTSQMSRSDYDDIRELYKIVVPVMLVACLVSMLFNLTIVWSVRWIRRTLSPTLYLSLSLALADAYTSLVLGLGLIVNSLIPYVYGLDLGPFHTCFILVLEAFRLGGVVVSVFHLLALAVNHYIGILRPLHYAATVTRRTAVGAIIAMWLLPVTFFLVYFASVPNDGFQSYRCESYNFVLHKPFRLTTSLLFFVPLFFMFIMYVHMFIVVRHHQQGLLQMPNTRQLHKNVKAIITTLLILGTYVLGWMPAVLYFILTCLDCPIPFPEIQLWVRLPVGIFINSMIVLKSFVDPIIYVVRMPEIKAALKTVWRTRCGFVADETTDLQLHSRTDINRMTFLVTSRKAKMNGQTNANSYA